MVAVLFLIPTFAPWVGLGRLANLLLLELVAVGGAYSISGRRRALYTAIVLSVPGIIAQWTGVLLRMDGFFAAGDILLAAAISYVVFVYVRHLLAAHEVDGELISASVSGYLMLGLIWAALYEAMYRLEPSCIKGASGTVGELTYFSFITLTTLGYGDVSPAASYVRAAAALEAVAGQLYVAITIARLVGLSAARK